MKKILGLFLILSLTLCGLPFSSNAAVEEVFEINNKTIEIIYAEDVFSSEKIEAIVRFVSDGGIENSSTYGILCIFGHKLEYSEVTTVEHYYYSTSPYCRETTYAVEACTRDSCSYMNKTVIDQSRTGYCHG